MSSQPTQVGEYVVRDEGICGGHARIAGTRIKVQQIMLQYEQRGMTPDDICDAYPGLSLPAVHSAISYYYDHRDEILDAVRKDQGFAESFRESLGPRN